MTKTERAKAITLSRCRFLPGSWDKRFARSMGWIAQHNPSVVLTKKQKWALDAMVYRYRRQVAGTDEFEMPTAPPARADYGVADDEPDPGHERPEPRASATQPRSPQESLF